MKTPTPFMKLPTLNQTQPKPNSPIPPPTQTGSVFGTQADGIKIGNPQPRHIDITRQMDTAQRGLVVRENQALAFNPPDWYSDEWNALPPDQRAAYIGLPEQFRSAIFYAKKLQQRGAQVVNYNGALVSPQKALHRIHQDIDKWMLKQKHQTKRYEKAVQAQPIPYRVMG